MAVSAKSKYTHTHTHQETQVPKIMVTYFHQKTCIRMFPAALFIINKHIKLPKYSSSIEWIKYSIIRILYNFGGKNPTAIQKMDKSSRIIVNKRHQTQKSKYCKTLSTWSSKTGKFISNK